MSATRRTLRTVTAAVRGLGVDAEDVRLVAGVVLITLLLSALVLYGAFIAAVALRTFVEVS